MTLLGSRGYNKGLILFINDFLQDKNAIPRKMKEKDIFEDLRIVIVVGLFSALKKCLN